MATIEFLLNRKCIIVPQLSAYECLKYYELPALFLVMSVIGVSLLIRYFKFKRLNHR